MKRVMNQLWYCWAVMMLFSSLTWASEAIVSTKPDLLVKTLSIRILADLSAQPVLKVDRAKALEYADRTIAPHFDFVRMTMLAVGQPWRSATTAQREALTHAFQALLIRTYIVAFSRYTDQKVRVEDADIRGTEALVKSMITGATVGDGSDVEVSYRLVLHQGKWQIYDVAVAGVSLVINYRPQFLQTIRAHGIDGLIDLLKKNIDQMSHA